METLVVVAQHRNQYYSRPEAHGPARFGSSSSRAFGGIDCRTFHSGTGILPTPLKSCSSPVTERPHSSSLRTPSPPTNSNFDRKTHSKITPKSAPIRINGRDCNKMRTFSEEVPDGNLLFSELWAGPTYSNSPPPSSLPIPKFSVRPKRTVSLNLPGSSPEIEMHPLAKSAPVSPTREHSPSTRDLFGNADSATKTLRRILNLNINDEVLLLFLVLAWLYLPWRVLTLLCLISREAVGETYRSHKMRSLSSTWSVMLQDFRVGFCARVICGLQICPVFSLFVFHSPQLVEHVLSTEIKEVLVTIIYIFCYI